MPALSARSLVSGRLRGPGDIILGNNSLGGDAELSHTSSWGQGLVRLRGTPSLLLLDAVSLDIAYLTL